jgi:hypothetical protein
MKNGDFIIDDFLKPLRDIIDAMEEERSETNVQT